jgi:hypothetical protein
VRLLTERKKNKLSSFKDLDIFVKDVAADRKVDAFLDQLEKTTQLVTSLPDDTVTNIMRNFKLPVRFAERFMLPRQTFVSSRWSVYMCMNMGQL